ncbi:MAG: sigma-54-dependent Fis family transcriptional regulator [Bdellovibrionales bacterium]|nr:sigma-54-dependent Fis family transcriptional regulator [Bdellovibrionales bacterium]
MARLVLVVDDEDSIRASLSGALADEGYRVQTASSGEEALSRIRSEKPDLILLDIWMPGMDGLETLSRIRKDQPSQTVIMMSGHGNIETAVRATKLGAYDFVEKPLSLEKLLLVMQNSLSAQDLARENQALREQVKSSRKMIGESAGMNQIREKIKRVAPTTGSVLITGENGTGKEVVAHQIHAMSLRVSKPFVEVNCAAIPEELIESELFGHEKGAFTGATQARRGKFDLANGGTIFLDEIGDMSLKTQAKVLRVIQEQKFERVGGSQTNTVDTRILAATNKDLRAEIAAGRFREDLFYRLNVIPFQVPPLRERKEDIPLLAGHFLDEAATTHSRKRRTLSSEAQKALTGYSWPGNVRELKNLVERLIILAPEASDGTPVTAAEILEHLSDEALAMPGGDEPISASAVSTDEGETPSLRDARQKFEREFILRVLKEQGGNVSKTATVLGIERSYLHKKIKGYGIEI